MRLKSDIPLYEGGDAKALHYQAMHDALDAAIAAVRSSVPLPTSADVEEVVRRFREIAAGTRGFYFSDFDLAATLLARLPMLEREKALEEAAIIADRAPLWGKSGKGAMRDAIAAAIRALPDVPAAGG